MISLTLPIQSWWRSSFNNWFFAQSCWEANPDVDTLLKEYYHAYYGEKAKEAEKIFHLIFTALQKEPYSNTQEASEARLVQAKSAGKQILHLLDEVIPQTQDPLIRERFNRVKTYVEFSVLHCEAYASRKKEDLHRLMEYSRQHAEHSMVLMYPGYIGWVAE